MLKKLVKYGNSNAIILDKAILELLEIEEGAIIKIKTDGKSIIITPQEKVAPSKVHEVFTHHQASLEASIREGFKRYEGLEKDQREKLEGEYLVILKKFQGLSEELSKNKDFIDAVDQLRKQCAITSPEFMANYKMLRDKHAPEHAKAEAELVAFEQLHNLKVHANTAKPSAEQIKEMEQDFYHVHQKNQEVYKKYAELMNNPEYQHEAQLIAEKYGADKNSAEYMQAIDALNDAYLPEFRKAQAEVKAVAAKYADKASK
ncbi:MAG: hypothetical protein AB7F19_05315 [Candidatus Babeliales bacterium]